MCLSCCSWQLKNAETARNLHNSCHHVSSLLDTRCFAKCFRHYSAFSKNRRSKSFSKKLYISMTKKKEEAQTKSRHQGIDHRRRQNVVKHQWHADKLYISMTKKKEEAQTKSRHQGIDHRRRQNVVKHQWHTRLRLVCHFFVFTTFWRHLWAITEQTHGNMESIC